MVRPLPAARRPCSSEPCRRAPARSSSPRSTSTRTRGSPRRSGSRGSPPSRRSGTGGWLREFVGVQPPAAVDQFLDSLLPSEADALVERGDEESLRRAHELEPTRADAAVPLAKILKDRGEIDEALTVLSRVPGSFAADGLAARIALESAARNSAQPPVPGSERGIRGARRRRSRARPRSADRSASELRRRARRGPPRGGRSPRRVGRRAPPGAGSRGAAWPPPSTDRSPSPPSRADADRGNATADFCALGCGDFVRMSSASCG